MIGIIQDERRRDFAIWLRTGRLPTMTEDGVELKFDPYHDPRNGQFTFAPGGPRSLYRVVVSRRGPRAVTAERLRGFHASPPTTGGQFAGQQMAPSVAAPRLQDAVFRPDESGSLTPVQFSRIPRLGRGGNSRAFEDPLTLEQTFPGLRDSPGGAIIALPTTSSTSPGQRAN